MSDDRIESGMEVADNDSVSAARRGIRVIGAVSPAAIGVGLGDHPIDGRFDEDRLNQQRSNVQFSG